jgi:(S)-ureidoglycine aminohydrolase
MRKILKNWCINYGSFMKSLILLFCLIPSLAFSQGKPIESKVYYWNDLTVNKRPQGESRPILEGTTPDFKLCKIHASTLLPKSRMRKEAYLQENEELIIVKEGELTVTIEGKTKVLKAGGMALIMSNDIRETENRSDENTTYYVFQYNSTEPIDLERGKKAGGSLMLNWDEVAFKPHDKGGRKDFFNRPTAMSKRFEMHTTTLNAGLMSHPPHTHKAAEIIFLINSQGDEATSQAQESIDGNWQDAKVGDIIFLQSNSLHGIRNTGKGTCTYFAFQFE